jgi:Mg-chelatase subunit ChlD
LYSFIDSLQAKGGTPLGNALKEANHFMQNNKSSTSKTQMILLLADGDDGCNNVDSVMVNLRKKGIIFRHETVGLGIDSNSNAARDLKIIANSSGGTYHQTHDPKRLNSIFLEAIETMQMLDMLGKFGSTHNNTNNSKSQSNIQGMQSIFDNFE